MKLAERGFWVYDFALPLLLLHAVYGRDAQYLKSWLEMSPKKQFTTLGNDDDAYLLARAVQLFAPGIPQVYYVGLLAGKNGIGLMENTKNGRNINRHYYSEDEVAREIKRGSFWSL